MRVKSKPIPPTDGTIKSLGHLVEKADANAGGLPVFRITSEVLDRHRDRVMPSGLKTENYLKNPVLLWNHNDWEPAIGTARVFQEKGEWFMEPSFDGIGDLSKDVAAKVAAKTLRTCSIRFRTKKHAYNEEGGLDYEEVELLEVSITNIPANPEAERVKKDAQQQQQKKSETTPEETEQSKALEQADLEAIQAALSEALKPCLDAIAELKVQVDALIAGAAEPGADAEKEAGEEESAADEDEAELEMSEEDEEEMKSFFQGVLGTKKK